ncbi:MAG: hypothetical protein JRJ58_12695 [Deltaproteobacteria bacterium]|nr:hypothetical protein [Deltaproteobacteria bacterium]
MIQVGVVVDLGLTAAVEDDRGDALTRKRRDCFDLDTGFDSSFSIEIGFNFNFKTVAIGLGWRRATE